MKYNQSALPDMKKYDDQINHHTNQSPLSLYITIGAFILGNIAVIGLLWLVFFLV
jgi:hypothetical protein